MADLDLDALRSELQESLEPGEDMDDVLATVRHLADRRANALGRETEQADLEFTASILCWYPFKTPPPDDIERQTKKIRSELIPGAAQGRTERIDQVVPDRTLTADQKQLADWQQHGVHEFLDRT